MTSSSKEPPWGRRDGESSRAWSYFRQYLMMPKPRSMAVLAKELGVNGGTLRNHSYKHAWIDRARAWDDHVAQREAQVTIEEVERSRRESIKGLTQLRDVAMRRLGTLIDDEIGARDVRPMIVDAVKALNLLYGEATERIDGSTTVGFDLSGLTDDEVATWRALVAKAADWEAEE